MNAKNTTKLVLLASVLAAGFGCKSQGGAAVAGEASAASSDTLVLEDPAGDDNGPGNFVYPTDKVYTKGAFDLRGLEVINKGDTVEFHLKVAARVEDPWDSKAWGGNGFSVQMAFIHIDTDHVAGSGVQDSLPGTNVRFAADEAWDRCVIISPQGPTRVNAEIEQKASQWKDKIVVPQITRASGRTLIAVVDVKDLGGAPAAGWGYQVLMQSNEGFPAKTDLLTRKVNEFEGQHRFGGGTDYDNDPQVIDILMAPAKGGEGEATAQHEVLSKWNKEATEPKPEDLAVVPMVYPAR